MADMGESLASEEVVAKRKRRNPTGQWCSAVGCKNSRYKRPDISFFRFPKDEERCKQWVKNCCRQDLQAKSAKHLFESNVLCALHFDNSQFTNSYRNRLLPLRAVPTLFHIPDLPASLGIKHKQPVSSLAERSIPVTSDQDKEQPTLFDIQDPPAVPGIKLEQPESSLADPYSPVTSDQDKERPALFDIQDPPAVPGIKLERPDSSLADPYSPVTSSLAEPSTMVTFDQAEAILLRNENHSQRETIESLEKKVDSQRKTLVLLRKKVASQRRAINRLRLKPEQLRKKAKLEVETIKAMSSRYLPTDAHRFFSSQLDLSLMRQQRWKGGEKRLALSLFHASPEAYRLLKKLFVLPSIRTLKRAMKRVEISRFSSEQPLCV